MSWDIPARAGQLYANPCSMRSVSPHKTSQRPRLRPRPHNLPSHGRAAQDYLRLPPRLVHRWAPAMPLGSAKPGSWKARRAHSRDPPPAFPYPVVDLSPRQGACFFSSWLFWGKKRNAPARITGLPSPGAAPRKSCAAGLCPTEVRRHHARLGGAFPL